MKASFAKCFKCPSNSSLVDEAVDGLVGVVLKGCVGQVGEDVRLVNQGTGESVGRAGVEYATRQGGIYDAVDQSPRTHVKFVSNDPGAALRIWLLYVMVA